MKRQDERSQRAENDGKKGRHKSGLFKALMLHLSLSEVHSDYMAVLMKQFKGVQEILAACWSTDSRKDST